DCKKTSETRNQGFLCERTGYIAEGPGGYENTLRHRDGKNWRHEEKHTVYPHWLDQKTHCEHDRERNYYETDKKRPYFDIGKSTYNDENAGYRGNQVHPWQVRCRRPCY